MKNPRSLSWTHLFWPTCWAVAAPLAALAVLWRVWPDGTWGLLLANMFLLYLLPPAYPVLVAALLRRRWILGVVAAVAVLAHLSVAVPPFLPRHPPPALGDEITLVSANLLMVHPAPDVLADELEQLDADVLMLQEYSSRWEAEFRKRSFYERYHYNVVVIRDDSFGSAIFSRIPLDNPGVVEMAGLPQTAATVSIGGEPVDLLNVHTLPPRISEYVPGHRRGLAAIEKWATEHQSSPFLIAGDLNAASCSRFHRRIKRIANDAWELAGQGYGHTAPNGVFPLPPMRLDHIYLSSDLTAHSARLGEGQGSDHRPIIVSVNLSRQ